MSNLVHHLKPDDVSTMVEATPFEFVYHHSYATSGMVVLHYKSCCSSLDTFQFINILFSQGGRTIPRELIMDLHKVFSTTKIYSKQMIFSGCF